MSMERSRRDRFTTIAPSGGEFLMGVLFAGLFMVAVTPLAVQGLVGWAVSGDFAFPSEHLLDAYAGLAQGHFGEGLRKHAAAGLPSDAVIWVLTGFAEVTALGAGVVVTMRIRSLTGSSSRHGLATSTQAGEALGLPRLRKTAAVIRPDLYSRNTRRTPGGRKLVGRRSRDGRD